MIDRTTRLRWRRRFKRSRRHVEDIGEQAEEQLERHFFRRLSRLNDVRRFIVSWILLLVILGGLVVVQIRALSQHYQEIRPVPGGIYTEGIIGAFTNANPIYAVGTVDNSVAQLVFSGLLRYDANNKLVGDLAESWKVDKTGRVYTATLRNNVFWHDGQPLTAQDVLFTYQLIQNPDTRSPLFGSWQGVKIEAPSDRKIVFTLPNILTAFPHSMTNGIVPKHILQTIPAAQLRSARFNTAEPIGSGPFKWEAVEVSGTTPDERQEQIGLVPNDRYYAGEPKIQRFIVRTFRNEERLLKSFDDQEVNAMVGLTSLPDNLRGQLNIRPYNIPVTGAVMVFFKTTQDSLKDKSVRQALIKSVDTTELVNGLGYPAVPVVSPFLSDHLGFDPKLVQYGFNVSSANKILDKAGWKRGADGIREKAKQKLTFRLYAQSTSDFAYVTQFLQKQWQAIGAEVEVHQPSESELQSVVAFHNYDAVLYGISLGVDPDVFAYWHSSQADVRAQNRLNLSEYQSEIADQALEGGRTRTDPKLRAVKYQPFLKAWRSDAPALALYQPRFLYVVRGGLYNFGPVTVNTPSDRLSNVHNWMIRQAKANKL